LSPHDDNGWGEHKLLILDSLRRIEGKVDTIDARQDELTQKFVKLETEGKVMKWSVSTILPLSVTLGVNYALKKLGIS